MDEMCGRSVCGGGGILVLMFVGYWLMNLIENWGKPKQARESKPKPVAVTAAGWLSGGSLLTVVIGVAVVGLIGVQAYTGHRDAKRGEVRQAAEAWIVDCEAKHPTPARPNPRREPLGPAAGYFASLPETTGKQVDAWAEREARVFLEGKGPRPELSCAQVKQIAGSLYP